MTEVVKDKKKELINLMNKSGFTFPKRIQFVYSKDIDTGKSSVIFTMWKDESIKLENIKFNSTRMILEGRQVNATVMIKDFKTFEEFYETFMDLKSKWLVKPKD